MGGIPLPWECRFVFSESFSRQQAGGRAFVVLFSALILPPIFVGGRARIFFEGPVKGLGGDIPRFLGDGLYFIVGVPQKLLGQMHTQVENIAIQILPGGLFEEPGKVRGVRWATAERAVRERSACRCLRI